MSLKCAVSESLLRLMLCELFLPGRGCLQFSGWCRLDCCLHVRQGGETAIGMKADHSFKTPIQTRPPKSQDRSLWSSRSEEHTSELQLLMRISYAVFCLKKKKKTTKENLEKNTNNNKSANNTWIITTE